VGLEPSRGSKSSPNVSRPTKILRADPKGRSFNRGGHDNSLGINIRKIQVTTKPEIIG